MRSNCFGANSLGIGDDDVNNSLTGSRLADSECHLLQTIWVYVEICGATALLSRILITRDSDGYWDVLAERAFDIIKRALTIQDAIQIGGFLDQSRSRAGPEAGRR